MIPHPIPEPFQTHLPVRHDLTPCRDAAQVLVNPGSPIPLALTFENRGVAPPAIPASCA
jgi:hypothetical protein